MGGQGYELYLNREDVLPAPGDPTNRSIWALCRLMSKIQKEEQMLENLSRDAPITGR